MQVLPARYPRFGTCRVQSRTLNPNETNRIFTGHIHTHPPIIARHCLLKTRSQQSSQSFADLLRAHEEPLRCSTIHLRVDAPTADPKRHGTR